MTELSAQRRQVLDALADEFLALTPRGRRMIGIDGPKGAGKSRFGHDLAEVLRERGVEVVEASHDDFARPSAERWARGRHSAWGNYHDTFDDGAFRRDLVEPFRVRATDASPQPPFRTRVFDLATDLPVDEPARTAGPDAVLVADGAFLHRPELRGLWHFSVWLEVDPAERTRRLAERDGLSTDPDDPLAARYSGAQELYVDDAHPNTAATAIVDNTDPDAPWRRFADYCVAPPRAR
ncbi:hypothetical protein ARHIZOSPH14_16870 [Agromyces rhizosphaerae]|uniref:Uridine kinase n=1 Tax=Agromyces rhizosphaerae TaxID=88374 RepID=A0A9W6CW62_9MICO|nr:uridine kinase [Agromyces rhizosphaerae]GLI27445.1 hypothetical protein ARHIZOSPH14_16870 [Agromyces rhizosphaerae]